MLSVERYLYSILWLIFQWQQTAYTSIYYLFVRLCFIVYFLTTWLIAVIDAEHLDRPESYRAKWMIYLTNWGYTICTLQALISVIMLVSTLLTEHKEGRHAHDKLTTLTYKVYWAVNVVATDVAFGITILFWSLIYEGKLRENYLNNPFSSRY